MAVIEKLPMKISFMTFACPTWSFEQVLDAAVRHRFQGIEFRCDAGHAHGVEAYAPAEVRQRMRQQLRDEGIEACCLATSLQMAQVRSLEDLPARIQLALDIGAPALRVFCGSGPEGMSIEQTIEAAARNLRQASHWAADAGIELWLETHDAASKAIDAAAIIRRTDHKAAGINYDNMHPYRMGEPVDITFSQLDGLVRHTHFHDSTNDPRQAEVKPLGLGALPIDAMFRGLMKLGYKGYLSGEWFGNQYGQTPDEALAAYRSDMLRLAQHHGVALAA